MNHSQRRWIVALLHVRHLIYSQTLTFPRALGKAAALGLIGVLSLASVASGQPADSPYGVAASGSSLGNVGEWFGPVGGAGVTSVRGFPEWRGVESPAGAWKWDRADELVKEAARRHIQINGILMGSAPGAADGPHAFPMNQLDGWGRFVEQSVGRYRQSITHWEVWNEPNGGFNDAKHATADYARLAAATLAAARKGSPAAKVGLSVASFDPAYLDHAIRAMRKDTAAERFDFLAVHPYELADALADPDGEIAYLSMATTIRQMLKGAAPEQTDAPIWITEVGRRVGTQGSHAISPQTAAEDLVKLYVMALAQGIQRVQWFEGRDPAGEEAGFGLIDRKGAPRPALTAFQTLTSTLGTKPAPAGWLQLGESGSGYGFLFRSADKTVSAAWAPARAKLNIKLMGDGIQALDGVTGQPVPRSADGALELSARPVWIVNPPAQWVEEAAKNQDKPFGWGGDHSRAESVTLTPGAPDDRCGLYQASPDATPRVAFADGSTGILVRGDQGVAFRLHPSFTPYEGRTYYIRIAVRRVAPGNVGMNVFYEVADSQGKTPYRNRGIWFGVPAKDGWHEHTWQLTEACFAKMWGHDFSLRPEQSVPFVIGRVQVSKTPFP